MKPGTPRPPRGFLTMATGKVGFLEMAVDMALSLRAHSTLPIALACDDGLLESARTRYANVFDHVQVVPDRFLHGRVRKYGAAEATPFEETVFVDADCMVLGPLDYLFESLAEHDMAMVGQQLTRSDDENHHGFSTRRLMVQFGLDRYLKTNSGIFCFRRDPGIEIMEACRECFLNEAKPRLKYSLLLGRWLGDEIAFGIVGGRRQLGSLPVPAPMYWPQEFESLDLAHPTKPLLHMIWPPRDSVVDELVESMRERRRAADVPGDGEAFWRDEVAKLKRMKRRRGFLERIGWW
jgi:hypothetical protein